MTKTLILLRGFHYKHSNNTGPIDWKLCYKSLFDNFISFIDKNNYDIFFQTYDSPELNELINVYKPNKYIVNSKSDINKLNQVQNIYKIMQIVENINKYDRIFITRFDVLYKLPFNKWNIKPNHINIFFKHPNQKINDVCFLIYPENIVEFKHKIKKCNKSNLHSIKFNKLHCMTMYKYYSDTDYPEYFPLNNNPYYILHRIRSWGFKNKEEAYKEAKKQGFIT